MDDKTRGIGDDAISGRGDESSRNYARPEEERKLTDRPRSSVPVASSNASTLRAEIDQTREELSETIDAIQEKLRPSNIVADATDRIKHATTERVRQMAGSASETAQSAMDRTRHMAGEIADGARQNAIPAAMIGIGVAWLLVDRLRSTGGRDTIQYRPSASSTRTPDYVASDDYYRQATEYGYDEDNSETFDRATDLASDARDAAVRAGRRARNQFQRLLHSNPLMVGAATIVIGAAVGMLLPKTERENQLLGETRDNVVDRAQDLARNAATRVREAAGDIAGQVTSEVVSGKDTQT
jgi:ElaB/YqjD/DUF883 family membrane-anchored ribosome-binding protein